jgi:hypothetical protein
MISVTKDQVALQVLRSVVDTAAESTGNITAPRSTSAAPTDSVFLSASAQKALDEIAQIASGNVATQSSTQTTLATSPTAAWFDPMRRRVWHAAADPTSHHPDLDGRQPVQLHRLYCPERRRGSTTCHRS